MGKIINIEEDKLRRRLRGISSENIHWGRRIAYGLLLRKGWTVNQKRVHRL